MNVLITNIQLTVPGGTVSYVRDLAAGLRVRGFNIEIFTYKIGAIGNVLLQEGFNVVTNLDDLKIRPDIIHAHHNPTAIDAIKKFRDVPVVYFLHDRLSLFDKPFKNKQVCCYVAVDYNCLDRFIIDAGILPQQTRVIYNWVNTDKFKLREHFKDKPSSALVFSNYATSSNHYRLIAEACKSAGLQLDALGEGMGKSVTNPEDFLGKYDLIFAKAKAAIESLATGAAVVVCDYAGIGGMVLQSNIRQYRKYNFGRKTLTRPYNADTIVEEINKFSAVENMVNAAVIRHEASFIKTLDEIIKMYDEIVQSYKSGKKGIKGNFSFYIQSSFIKAYFFFSMTKLFKVLSAVKHFLKNHLKYRM